MGVKTHRHHFCWCGQRHQDTLPEPVTVAEYEMPPDEPPAHALWNAKPRNTAPRTPRPATRPRARRSPRRGTVKTAQDPGSDDDGDSDPDSDPVGAAVARLLADAPPFSVGQRELLGRILGGVS